MKEASKSWLSVKKKKEQQSELQQGKRSSFRYGQHTYIHGGGRG